MNTARELGELVKAKARDLGFDAVGFARADVPLDKDHERYEEFLAAGLHGTMQYLSENAEVRRRLDTDAILADAKSVVCVARRYRRDAASEDADPPLARGVARYARGHDYHNVVRRKLRRLAVFLRGLGSDESPVHARPMLDDAPVLERAWAARAGLGFVGKNGLLIVPGEGSLLVLGEVVTTLDLLPDAPMAERCGACTRCLDACPTDAFARPFVLDARKCISYLTIELRGPIPEPLREQVGDHLFGCDDCQIVCPFNGGSRPRDAEATRTFEPLPLFSGLSLEDLLALDGAGWSTLAEGSPLKRAEIDGIARNAAVVLGNRGDVAAIPALSRASEAHPSAMVRDAAGWALGRLGLPTSSRRALPLCTMPMQDLSKRVLARDVRAVARVLRHVDDQVEGHVQILKDLFPETGRAFILGVTGNPGAGKSTLCDRIIAIYRAAGKRVAVICVDPTSPYSGGAILGDRIRMQRHSLDDGVFIRSVATRGHMGGLSRSARDMVRVLDAYGSDVVLVETVGVGQDELEITRTAHTTLVVMAPGMGDEVQAIKAGIMESADVFVVNKADKDGADGTVRDIELMIALGSEVMIASGKARGHTVHSKAALVGRVEGAEAETLPEQWTPPIVRCVSTRGDGVEELVKAAERHRAWLLGTEAGREQRRLRLSQELREGLREALIHEAVRSIHDELDVAVRDVEAKLIDPYTATERLIEAFRAKG